MPSDLKDSDWRFLLRRVGRGLFTPFLGAGVHDTLPTARDLAKELADEFDYPFTLRGDGSELPKVAQYAAVDQDPLEPKIAVVEILKSRPAPDLDVSSNPLAVLARLPLKIYITTNYDNYLFDAIAQQEGRSPVLRVCTWKPGLVEELGELNDRGGSRPTVESPWVFHLHGHWDYPSSLVLTEDDYLDFLVNLSRDERLIPSVVEAGMSQASLLFVGYRLGDPNFLVLYRSLISRVDKSGNAKDVAVQLPPQEEIPKGREDDVRNYLKRYFENQNVDVFWHDLRQFLGELGERWDQSQAKS